MASKRKKRELLHKQRMAQQAKQAKSKDGFEELKERCMHNNRSRESQQWHKEKFWREYRESFGSWEPPEPSGNMTEKCSRKSIFDDHLFKK